MENSGIEWTDHTFNPWIGCTKVHEGCRHCYAEADQAIRRGRVVWGPNGTRSKTSEAYWKQPLKWNREANRVRNFAEMRGMEFERPRVFCASLADIFEDIPLVEWKEFAKGYRVSIFGIVQSRWRAGGHLTNEWRDIRPTSGKGGYLYFDVKGSDPRGTVKIHKIVIEAFVGPPPDGEPCVRHIDGDPSNNCLWNLLYGTQQENQEDMKRHGTARTGTRNGRSKLNPNQVDEIKEACSAGESQSSVAERYGVTQGTVSKIILGRRWNGPVDVAPFDGRRNASIGHVVDHKSRPVFRCECCNEHSTEPGICQRCSQERGPLTLDDLRRDLFALIDQTPHLDWLLVTKRPENIRKMWPSLHQRHNSIEESRVPVVGFPGYEVSNLGDVYQLEGSTRCCNCGADTLADPGFARRKYCSPRCRQEAWRRAKSGGTRERYPATSRPLSPSKSSSGHLTVHLSRSGVKTPLLVHRLVLSHFDRPSKSGEECRHLDGNPGNNRIDNLRWGTQSENWSDSKRHGTHRRYSKLSEDEVDEIRVAHQCGDTFSALAIRYDVSATQIRNICRGIQWQSAAGPYRQNCWLLTSVSDQESADKQIPELLKCRDLCPVLGLSAEPLLGPIEFSNISNRADWKEQWGKQALAGIGWVIVGGESGPGARPMHPQWARSIRDQCKAAGVPYFFKQGSSNNWESYKDFDSFPVDLQTRQFPEVHHAAR